jgi:hypothetical protein
MVAFRTDHSVSRRQTRKKGKLARVFSLTSQQESTTSLHGWSVVHYGCFFWEGGNIVVHGTLQGVFVGNYRSDTSIASHGGSLGTTRCFGCLYILEFFGRLVNGCVLVPNPTFTGDGEVGNAGQ